MLDFALILEKFNPNMGGLILCTNGSDLTIGAMLMQGGQLIAYEFRKLTPIELNYLMRSQVPWYIQTEPKYRNSGKVGDSGHTPNSQH
jgi:hypothetical protein